MNIARFPVCLDWVEAGREVVLIDATPPNALWPTHAVIADVFAQEGEPVLVGLRPQTPRRGYLGNDDHVVVPLGKLYLHYMPR